MLKMNTMILILIISNILKEIILLKISVYFQDNRATKNSQAVLKYHNF